MSSQIVGPRRTSPQRSSDEVAPGGEVAVLVEDAVVGEELLAIDPANLSAREDRARVREVTVEEGAADERRDPLGRGGDLVE